MRTPWARLVSFAAFALVLAATFFLGRPRAEAEATPEPYRISAAADPASTRFQQLPEYSREIPRQGRRDGQLLGHLVRAVPQ